MPMNIKVGLAKKVGLPAYGSLGATCEVTFEAEYRLLDADLEGFHQRVKNTFAACRQAVQEELTRQQQPPGSTNGNGHAEEPRPADAPPSAPAHNGNGRGVSEKQLDYARQLARQLQGVGIRRLEALAQKLSGKSLAAMSSLDASGLIHTLKAVKAGEIDLDALLKGAAA